MTSAAEHWRTWTGDSESIDLEIDLSEPSGELVEHGEVDAIAYRAKQDGGRLVDYEHVFRRGAAPVLCFDSDGVAYLMGGRYTVESDHGIVDGGRRRPMEVVLPEFRGPEEPADTWVLGEMIEIRISPYGLEEIEAGEGATLEADPEPWSAAWGAEGGGEPGPLLLVDSSGGLQFESWSEPEV